SEEAADGGRRLLPRVPVDHVAAVDGERRQPLAERRAVVAQVVVADEPELAGVNQQGRRAQRLRRGRRRGELRVERDDRPLAVAEAEAPVPLLDEVLAHLLLEIRARRSGAGLE